MDAGYQSNGYPFVGSVLLVHLDLVAGCFCAVKRCDGVSYGPYVGDYPFGLDAIGVSVPSLQAVFFGRLP